MKENLLQNKRFVDIMKTRIKREMKLSINQIRSITTGVVYIEEKESGLKFHRFSKGQEEYLSKPHKYFSEEFFCSKFGACYFGLVAQGTAGVSFDFYTDAEEVKIEIGELIIPTTHKIQNFDVYINNRFLKSFEADKDILFLLSGGKKRVTVYFPWGNSAIIKSVTLKNATVLIPAYQGTDVLCIGDSITQGANSAYPSITWVTVMARKLGVSVINQGVCGFVNDENLVEKVCEPKVVITAFGINDYYRKTNVQLGQEADAFIKKVRSCYPNSKLFSILPLWTLWNAQSVDWGEDKRAILKAVYEKNDVHIIDGFKMMPHNIKYIEDGILHPNAEGFRYYGNRVAKVVEEKFLK